MWALRGVDVSIDPGESVGIIGRNGSGKTTLMSMLCGVTGPTEGRVRVGGRIAPLISVGVGFHPELTGRENVFVNGTILGLTRTELERRLDEIVAFAEIDDFLDTPVKFYSSGMYLRLGFSVAAHVDPDVMLIDEVLAVGDFAFQLKCFNHLRKLRQNGTTTVMVSHNLPALEAYCSRGVLLDRGNLIFDGDIGGGVAAFQELIGAAGLDDAAVPPGEEPLEADLLDVVAVETLGPAGATQRFASGDTARVRITVNSRGRIRYPFASVSITSNDGVVVYRERNDVAPYAPLEPGVPTSFDVEIPLRLTTGQYVLSYAVGRANPSATTRAELAQDVAWLTPERRLPIYVAGRPNALGVADLRATFDGQAPPEASDLSKPVASRDGG
jgi:lipopolysaccharide transport system ATP-binding protein